MLFISCLCVIIFVDFVFELSGIRVVFFVFSLFFCGCAFRNFSRAKLDSCPVNALCVRVDESVALSFDFAELLFSDLSRIAFLRGIKISRCISSDNFLVVDLVATNVDHAQFLSDLTVAGATIFFVLDLELKFDGYSRKKRIFVEQRMMRQFSVPSYFAGSVFLVRRQLLRKAAEKIVDFLKLQLAM